MEGELHENSEDQAADMAGKGWGGRKQNPDDMSHGGKSNKGARKKAGAE